MNESKPPRTIWKYELNGADNALEMPIDSHVLTVQMQRRPGVPLVTPNMLPPSRPVLWALVQPSADKVVRRFVILGTGHDVPSIVHGSGYVATFQDGVLVFHVFEVR